MTEPTDLPSTEYAVQLVAPNELELNRSKPVPTPSGRQILAKVEAVGLCFSDLKLLKQFADHPRKGPITSGLGQDVLAELPSYVPGTAPTVPGHEVVCRVVAVGDDVRHHAVGQRCMVQADYRHVLTAGSNAAFGYNLEGGLQQYVLFDERIVAPSADERFLIEVDDDKSASAVALVEPWACVENSYATGERRTLKAGGRLAVVVETGGELKGLQESFSPDGPPESVSAVCDDAAFAALKEIVPDAQRFESASALADEGFDDVVYFGASKQAVETLNDKLASHGIINIVTAGERFGEDVSVGVGRLHYGTTRWVGTLGDSAAEGYAMIPATGELRDGDKVCVVGAGGPMGQMHTIRAVCSDRKNLEVLATDLDDERLEALQSKADAISARTGVGIRTINTQDSPLGEECSYFALMAPVGALVVDAVNHASDGCLVNIFAGIPAPTRQDLDLDRILEKRIFLFGTSGSRIADMQAVLEKVNAGRLDTNASVDAVSGMAGAIDGIRAVENRTMAGKIMVYPAIREMGLVRLTDLAGQYPTVAEKLSDGMWTAEAEAELLKVAR